jgi:hypothetical protein
MTASVPCPFKSRQSANCFANRPAVGDSSSNFEGILATLVAAIMSAKLRRTPCLSPALAWLKA